MKTFSFREFNRTTGATRLIRPVLAPDEGTARKTAQSLALLGNEVALLPFVDAQSRAAEALAVLHTHPLDAAQRAPQSSVETLVVPADLLSTLAGFASEQAHLYRGMPTQDKWLALYRQIRTRTADATQEPWSP